MTGVNNAGIVGKHPHICSRNPYVNYLGENENSKYFDQHHSRTRNIIP